MPRKKNAEEIKETEKIEKENKKESKPEENKPSYFMRDIKHASGYPSLYLPIYPIFGKFIS